MPVGAAVADPCAGAEVDPALVAGALCADEVYAGGAEAAPVAVAEEYADGAPAGEEYPDGAPAGGEYADGAAAGEDALDLWCGRRWWAEAGPLPTGLTAADVAAELAAGAGLLAADAEDAGALYAGTPVPVPWGAVEFEPPAAPQ